MNIISNISIPVNIISVDDKLASIFLIIILAISLLVSDTRYWNIYASNTLNIFSDPIFLVFIGIIVYDIILVMKI